jgi:uncharacterized protein (DUF952 family)
MKLVAHITPNQQWDEGADLGAVEPGCDPVQAFVHLARVEPIGELFTHLVSDVLQVCVDLGPTRAGVKRGRACHAFNVVRENSAGAAGI